MLLINEKDKNQNWFRVLNLWSHIANWIHYKPEHLELNNKLINISILLWSEKDWLISRYPDMKKIIEGCINNSKYMAVVGDIANHAKHCEPNLTRKRSKASLIDCQGIININNIERYTYHINLGNGLIIEALPLIEGAINEFSYLRNELGKTE